MTLIDAHLSPEIGFSHRQATFRLTYQATYLYWRLFWQYLQADTVSLILVFQATNLGVQWLQRIGQKFQWACQMRRQRSRRFWLNFASLTRKSIIVPTLWKFIKSKSNTLLIIDSGWFSLIWWCFCRDWTLESKIMFLAKFLRQNSFSGKFKQQVKLCLYP